MADDDEGVHLDSIADPQGCAEAETESMERP
jgi:hypothetical protein